jgi:hypothetical protein
MFNDPLLAVSVVSGSRLASPQAAKLKRYMAEIIQNPSVAS